MKKTTLVLTLFFAVLLSAFWIDSMSNDSVPTTTKLRVRIVGDQGESLINLQTTVEHVSGFHPTTQVEKNVYGDPSSPEETLSITDIQSGQTGEIVIHIDKSIKIP